MNIDGNLVKGGPNRIIPLVKQATFESVENVFKTLSDFGRKPHQLLFESADLIPFYGKMSIIVYDPCLKISGTGTSFCIEALDATGERFLDAILPDVSGIATCARESKSLLTGTIPSVARNIDEMARLKEVTPFHILRILLNKLRPVYIPEHLFAGLFGAISYDFVDIFESLPAPAMDPQKEPDYELYYGNTLLIADHEKMKLNIISNALIFKEEDAVPAFLEATGIIERIEKLLAEEQRPAPGAMAAPMKIEEEMKRDEFVEVVKRMKEHIAAGDIFQVVPSRTVIVEGVPSPWSIYLTLRRINPSPYMFYVNDGRGVLLGASPEMLLRITVGEKRIVETRPIAGTRPRGIIDGAIDPELDSRQESSLKTDFKELAEHSMLIDLGRNDIAKVSKPGTRIVKDPYHTEKFSHVQHLVTKVQGELSDDLDAFNAYLSAMNAGTLTGAPKLKAMELLRRYERFKRGFYGGAAGYFGINGDMDTCIIIRSMRILDNRAYLRAGAGIVYDSVPELEYEETERKLAATIAAIRTAAKYEGAL